MKKTEEVCKNAGKEGNFDLSVINFLAPEIQNAVQLRGRPGPCQYCPISEVMCRSCYEVFDHKLEVDVQFAA